MITPTSTLASGGTAPAPPRKPVNTKTAAEYWHTKGLPKNKIIIGFATYGRSWSLVDRGKSEVGAPGGRAKAGKFTKEAGFLAYYEICELVAQGAKRRFDTVQKVPYIVSDDQWIGFDDRESFQLKVNALIYYNVL
uniref:GH18 domain-containing protein n=1 Tax=Romanomermis culicivorax TaxID=13658 RepID=A0A915L5Y8_ROMCU